jgi:hypothetical protein
MHETRAAVMEANIATAIRDEAKALALELECDAMGKAAAIDAARRAVARLVKEWQA